MSITRKIKMNGTVKGEDLTNVTITKDVTKLGTGKTVLKMRLADGREYAFDQAWAVKMADTLEGQNWEEREPRRREMIARLRQAVGQ